MTSGVNGPTMQHTRSPAAMQPGQHTMGPNGNPGPQQQNPGNPSQQQQDQMMSGGPSGQPVPMGQPMPAGTYQQPILSSPMGAPGAQPQYQYVIVNQNGQQMLQPTMSVMPGMAMPTQNPQQQGQQQIIYMQPQPQKQGGQQPQMMTSGGPAASQSATKSMSQAPTYTLTSSGIVSQTGGPQFMVVGGPAAMGGSPTLQAAGPNMSMSTSASMPAHIKAEPGKQMATAQQQQQQAQQVGQQPMQLLPPGYVNAVQPSPGQAYINQNGQLFTIRAPGPQDGQATSQIMFSPQGLSMQAHPQPMQPGLPSQQLPQGLSTSMQPMNPMASTGGPNVVRAPVSGYPSQAPMGKTQISRAQPTLLPATSSSTNATNRMSTTAPSFVTQPSPRSKQKQMSPRTTGAPTLSTKGLNTQAAAKSILNNIKQQNQMMQGSSGGSPPLLTSSASPLSMLPPGSPSAQTGPPVLQTSLIAPPPQSSLNSNSQPPLLHPMTGGPIMMPTPTSGISNTTSSYVNGGRPVTMATTLSVTSAGGFKSIDTSGKVPIRQGPGGGLTANKLIPAAPMEPISKPSNHSLPPPTSQSSIRPPQECLTHVIDGHVIHESSQPFPLEEDVNGRNRKKSESKITPPTVNLPATPTLSSVANRPPAHPTFTSTPSTPLSAPLAPPQPQATSKLESSESRKRGPGRPPGSTKQNIEQQRMLQQQQQQQQQQTFQSGDIVKVNKDGSPDKKKPKIDFESGPTPGLLSNNSQPAITAPNPAPPALPPPAPIAVQAPTPPTPITPTPTPVSEVKSKYNIDIVLNNPLKWTVSQVCDFVKTLPGCSDYVDDFQLQEIDGQALMLLKADILMRAMAIKLGPALKICNAIEAMREELKQN